MPRNSSRNRSGSDGNTRHGAAPQAGVDYIEAQPKGYSIDVRVFLAVITATMALAFAAGVMVGPTSPVIVDPIVRLLGLSLPAAERGGAGSSSSRKPPGDAITAPARKMPEGSGGAGGVPDPSTLSATSKKAREVEVTADGEIVAATATGGKIQQPRRLPTDHVATLGYKIKETHVNIDEPVLEGTGDLPGADRDISYATAAGRAKGDQYRDQTSPSGQHLLIDIKNLEAAFLNSESRLAAAMQGSVIAAGLTMLSYHCHSLHPAGVSCVGVLLESHISFHTWPDEGVITLDLFTTSERPLLPALPDIEALFGVARDDPATGEKMTPGVLWSHELRGFRTEDARRAHHLDGNSDLAAQVMSPIEIIYKKQIVSLQTEHQRIDIWDIIDREATPNYEEGLKLGLAVDDPRWLSNKYASPQRILFLDGSMQTQSDSYQELHESLVHAAMFTHPNPETVVIIGGGEGAALAEVLKHKTVKKVVMVELDPKVVEVMREHFPKLSDCSDIPHSSGGSCYDDPRVELVFADGFDYLLKKKVSDVDVLVVDTKDPEDHDEYTDPKIVGALMSCLSPEGVMVLKAGTAPSILDPRADRGVNPKRERLIVNLEADPLASSLHVYEEAHCGYYEPRSFLLACRAVSCRRGWYAETDEVDGRIVERVGKSKSGKPSLVHYDGATQRSFHAPPRAWEEVYCRRDPQPFECSFRGMDLAKELFEFLPDEPEKSAFEIREDDEGSSAVFAKVIIPEGSYVMPSQLASSLVVSDETMAELASKEDGVDLVAHAHGSLQAGASKNFVEVGASLSMRTAGDGKGGEANVRRWIPAHPSGAGRPKWSPVYDRHRHSFDVFLVASRDILKGEEVVKPSGLWEEK